MWFPFLLVAAGGAMGALCRYAAALLLYAWLKSPAIPYATMAVNLLGCLAIGALAGWGETRPGGLSQPARLFLMTGLLGGFTTFSAFGLETFELLRLGRTGPALVYAGVQCILGLAAVALGFALAAAPSAGLPR